MDMTFTSFPCLFKQGVLNVAAISLAISWPTMASAPHLIVNGFKRLLAIAVQTDIDFAEASKVQ